MQPIDQFRLRDKHAVIIGGARNLGFDMAQALASAGCNLVITSRNATEAAKSAEQLQNDYSIKVTPIELDVCNHAEVEVVARNCFNWCGCVDVLINNAGGSLGLSPTHFFERNPEHIRTLIDVNLVGLLFCCQQFGERMIEQRHGKIINIASIAGIVGRDRRIYEHEGMSEQPVDYAAAKAGVIGCTRDLAALLGPHGICVNSISPGGFERGQPTGFIRDYSDHTPLGRMGRDGHDIQGAVLFLASQASNYVTGHNLVVDGGYTIWS